MVGKKINNYELRELVGDGAMGVVYLAEHPVLRRRVAVKLLKRQYLESPSLVTRFVNEARAAAAIHHPNVIEVIDVGMVEQEIPYIMMEYLDGEPLSRRLARERIGIGKAVDITIQAARAVAASHAIEIVHRDLKPENLFLVPDPLSPGGERVKVLDFGIAKLRPDWAGSDGPKTRTGVIFGTPAYMSPEQCRGLNDEVDHSTDVYALGCILFEMLCGRAPYISPGWGDVLMMHMSDEIPLPSKENPRVPPAIDQIVLTALAKKKTERFASMRDMHRALAQARNDVEDTPAPTHRTDPVLPAVVLGLGQDAHVGNVGHVPPGARPADGGHPVRVSQDAVGVNDTFTLAPARRRLRSFVIAGAVALGGIGGTLAVRRLGTAEPPRLMVPAPAQAAEQPAARPAPVPPAEPVGGSVADAPVPAGADEEAAAPGNVKVAASESAKPRSAERRSAERRSAKHKSEKPHRPSSSRNDPVKW